MQVKVNLILRNVVTLVMFLLFMYFLTRLYSCKPRPIWRTVTTGFENGHILNITYIFVICLLIVTVSYSSNLWTLQSRFVLEYLSHGQ